MQGSNSQCLWWHYHSAPKPLTVGDIPRQTWHCMKSLRWQQVHNGLGMENMSLEWWGKWVSSLPTVVNTCRGKEGAWCLHVAAESCPIARETAPQPPSLHCSAGSISTKKRDRDRDEEHPDFSVTLHWPTNPSLGKTPRRRAYPLATSQCCLPISSLKGFSSHTLSFTKYFNMNNINIK